MSIRSTSLGPRTDAPAPAAPSTRVAAALIATAVAVEAWRLAAFHPGGISPRALGLLLAAWGALGTAAGLLLAACAGRRRMARLARLLPGFVLAGFGVVAALGIVAALREPSPPPPARQHAATAVPGVPRPNVILVVIDTLRADHLGCFGYERATSPRIDRAAAEGVLFTRAISQASWTTPATASLLTAQFPSTHGANGDKRGLPEEAVLLSEVLHDAGYATAGFSANPHVSAGYGFVQGWDQFWLVPVVRGLRLTVLFSALQRLNRLVDPDAGLMAALMRRVTRTRNATRDVRLNTAIASWLDGRPPEPFFLYAHYMSAHRPFDPPAPYDRAFTTGAAGPTDYPPEVTPFEPGRPLPEAARRELVARYDGAVLHADHVVGELLDMLAARGLLDRALLVLTADHGEEFYDHEAWGHGQSLYQELLHVPLVLRQPGRLPAGRRVSDVVMTVDVMPTILELAGVPVPSGLAGRSLRPLLEEPDDAWRDEAYAELLYPRADAQALIRGDRKVIDVHTSTASWTEHYDLAHDPGEHDDLGAGNATPDLARLHDLQAAAEAAALRPSPARPGWEEPLRALGYLE